ncbi:DNA replication licensing factor MCM6 [Linum perenne]
MDAFGGYFMDEKAVQVENIFLEFLKRFESYLKNACKRFVMEFKPTFISDDNPDKDINVAFFNIPFSKRLRELTTAEIGKLVSVRPELLHGTFKCLECAGVIKNVEQQFKYTEPVICVNATCNNKMRWALLRTESKFTDWQRSLDVILRHDIVEQARAGDTVIFTGTVVVRKNSGLGNDGVKGLRALGVRDLSYRLAFIANSVQVVLLLPGSYQTIIEVTKELEEIQRMRNIPDFFNKLVDSVAPTVFGHQDIKRAILLMLLGGVHKFTHEGINLRGDINVCIVGDPSCIVPRSVYTSGKSSSAAGLTATVAKEPETGEFCIEAGALMLADNGISAANPTGGRYDKSKPLKYNVALPPAILSRFDLVYVMIDDPDDQTDYHIAHHIVRVHQKREAALAPTFTTAELKRYIGYAKTLKPKVEARKLLVESYVSLRKGDTTPGTRVAYRMTVRQLEALVRLSEAIARSYLDLQVFLIFQHDYFLQIFFLSLPFHSRDHLFFRSNRGMFV